MKATLLGHFEVFSIYYIKFAKKQNILRDG